MNPPDPARHEKIAVALAEHGNFGVIAIDANERVTLWNAWMASQTGIRASQAANRALSELLPHLPESLWQAIDEALHRGLPRILSPTFHSPWIWRGRVLNPLVQVMPIFGIEGQVQGCAILIQDTTPQLSYEQARELRYRAILENIHEGVWVLDAEAKTTFVNARMAEMLGYTREEMLGRPVYDFMEEDVRPDAEAQFYRRSQGESEQHEFRFRRKDGAPLWAIVSATPLFDAQGRFIGALGLITDITPRRQMEQATRDYARRLEVLHELDLAILSARSPQEIARMAIEYVGRWFSALRASVVTFDMERNEAHLLAVYSPERVGAALGEHYTLEAFGDVERLRMGEIVVTEDVSQKGDLSATVRQLAVEGIRSYMKVPLMARDRLLGSLNVAVGRANAFTHLDQIVARQFANQIAIALEQAQLHQEAQRHLAELTAIHAASQRLQQILSPEALAQEIISIVEDTLGYENVAVLLIEDPSDVQPPRLIPYALSDQRKGREFIERDKAYILSHDLRVGEGITGWVAATGQTLRLDDVRQDPRYYPMRPDIRSELCVPLKAGDRIIGVLNVETTRPAAYTASDQYVLETIAAQIAVAIENSRYVRQLQQQADEMRALAIRLAQAEEMERRRLARELHDRVGQDLTALSINLNLTRGLIPAELQPLVADRIDESMELAEHIANTVRDVMSDLRPAILDDYGLLPTLRWTAERFSKRTGVRATVEGSELSERLPPEVETALFRIAQEALTNVARHAQASRVTITLETGRERVRLRVADDGVGFEPTQIDRQGRPHWGIRTMRERALAIGGEVHVQSEPGKGTQVCVQVPLSQAPLEGQD
ncbi:MAG: hypothetical protein Kow0047_24920 [Anaerolineae bacterium]